MPLKPSAAETAALPQRQPSPPPNPPSSQTVGADAMGAGVTLAESEAMKILVKYKHYVETKLTPQLQRSIDEADALREELKRRNEELETTTVALEAAKDTSVRLRMVLDQERLSLNEQHKDHLRAVAQTHQTEVKQLTAELNSIRETIGASDATKGKLMQLERILELRDGEVRKLQLQLTQQQQKQQQTSKNFDFAQSGAHPVDALSEEGLLMGSDPTTSNILSAVATELESLVQESLGYSLAMNAACQQAGVPDAMGASATQWRGSDLSVVARTLQNASLASKQSAVFTANVMLQAISRIKNCVTEERACVTTALGAIVGTHADTLTSVGGRELELARIRDVHQQRIEELERDFDTQIRLLQTQLQHQGQYMHGNAAALGGGRGGVLGMSGGVTSRSLSRAGTTDYMGLVPDVESKTTDKKGGTEVSHFDTLSFMSGQRNAVAANSQPSHPRSTTEGGNHTRTLATQTTLDINVLFPGMGFGSFADGMAVSGGGAARRTASTNNSPSQQQNGMVAGRSVSASNVGMTTNIELLKAEEIDGHAVARLVAELTVLEETNARLTAENNMLKEERRRHLSFMRMGNVSAREQLVLANGSVADLLLQ